MFFGNGINNTWKQANESKNLLEDAVRARYAIPQECLHFDVAYDSLFVDSDNKVITVVNGILQVLDAAAQRGITDVGEIWRWQSGEPSPSWYGDIWAALFARIAAAYQPDLRTQTDRYSGELATGRNVIVVAHSQGNFYVNQAYDLLAPPLTRFATIAVATPALRVAGAGPWYTLFHDIILATFPKPPNIANDPPSPCLTGDAIGCHNFDGSYITGNKTRAAIVNSVVSALPSSTTGGRYTLIDLGVTAPTASVVALNNYGDVIGNVDVKNSQGWPLSHPFIYSSASRILTDLGPRFPDFMENGDGGVHATGLNDLGQMAGIGYSISLGTRWFVYNGETGGTVPLSVPLSFGATSTTGINNSGVTVGAAIDTSSRCVAVVWDGYGGASVLSDLAGAGVVNPYNPSCIGGSAATGLNNRGQIIGLSGTHPVMWSAGVVRDLGMGSSSWLYAWPTRVNDGGDVVGTASTTETVHAFLYSAGVMKDLDVLFNLSGSRAVGINNTGQIVGHGWQVIKDTNGRPAGTRPPTAFLYSDGQVYKLNDLLAPGTVCSSGVATNCVVLQYAYAINDRGQILCGGILNNDYNSPMHFFLLTPR